MTSKESTQLNVAYFAMRKTLDNDGHIGAALVVDDRGVPQEFRCTHPVRPSTTQKALYGASIQSYITFDLCGQPLIESLSSKPFVCLVETEDELVLQEYVSMPVVYAQRLGDLHQAFESDENGSAVDPALKRRRRLERPRDFDPISVQCHSGNESRIDDLLPRLQEVFRLIDVLEPFERISVAVKTLGQRDKRFQ